MCRAPTLCPVEAARSHSPAMVKAAGVTLDPTVSPTSWGRMRPRGGAASVGPGGASPPIAKTGRKGILLLKPIL